MSQSGELERVYVELDFHDGPKSGVANVTGRPHRFAAPFDDAIDEYSNDFFVWPIDQDTLALEIEQWRIFVEWYESYEDGKADTESHPAVGRVNSRWDELDEVLQLSRSKVPPYAQKAEAVFESLEKQSRFDVDGPNYRVRWCFL